MKAVLRAITSVMMGAMVGMTVMIGMAPSARATRPPTASPVNPPNPPVNSPAVANSPVDIPPAVLEQSPMLRRWVEQVPNVLSDIQQEPSFRTRLRLGYAQYSSTDEAGIQLGVDDLLIGRTGLTVNADYQASFQGDRQAYGSDLRYYLLPLGSSINVAPVVGYRRVEGDRTATDGVNVGVRVLLQLSRTGAADVALSQTWVAPGSSHEVGLSTLSFGYAITPDLRLSTDLQRQNAPTQKENRIGLVLEWMP